MRIFFRPGLELEGFFERVATEVFSSKTRKVDGGWTLVMWCFQIGHVVAANWAISALALEYRGFKGFPCHLAHLQDQDSQMSVQELRYHFGPLLADASAFEVIQDRLRTESLFVSG